MIDPDIQRFVDSIAGAYAMHPDFPTLSMERKRVVAEATRERWSAGGPAMLYTRDAVTRRLRVRLRLHYPAAVSLAPAIVYMHGGGWTLFSVRSHDRLMREYAARTGAIVVGVDYSLAPEAMFPAQLEEVADVVGWLGESGESIGIDPTRIVLAGDSAGANLAIAAALRLRHAGTEPAVRALLLNYGVYDTDFTRPSYARFGGGGYLLTLAEMEWMWSQYIGNAAGGRSPLARPLHADLAGLPPCFMVVAEADILHDENLLMAERLAAAGVPATAIVYPGTVHGFLEAVAIAAVSARALDDSARWLATVLGDGELTGPSIHGGIQGGGDAAPLQ